jgi:hypothetical protein
MACSDSDLICRTSVNPLKSIIHPRSDVPVEKQLVKKFLRFYEHESELPCLQEPGSGPYLEPDNSDLYFAVNLIYF